ncbi:MAG: hypothetical protein ACRETN_00605 [Nevskiales bacterium]
MRPASAGASADGCVRRVSCWLAPVLFFLTACSPAPSLRWDGEAGVGYDSNVNNAAQERRTLSSGVIVVGGTAEYARPLNPQTTLFTRGGLKAESYSRVDGLSNLKLSLLSRLLFRPADAFHAPSFSLWGSVAYAEFDSRLRDGGEYRFGAFLDKPLSTALSTRLSLSAARRSADSRVFDGSSASAGLQLDWRLNSALLLYGGYQFRAGDVVSSSLPDMTLLGIAAARAPDDVFAAGDIAYRLDADTHVGTLGFNRALAANLALDAQLQYIRSEAGEGIDYSRWIGLISLLKRF